MIGDLESIEKDYLEEPLKLLEFNNAVFTYTRTIQVSANEDIVIYYGTMNYGGFTRKKCELSKEGIKSILNKRQLK